MALRRQNWYNLNAQRAYPLDEQATGTGDDGQRFRDDILVDCHLRWPAEYGEFAFVAGVTVTEQLLTVVFALASDLSDEATFSPLGSVSLLQPVTRYQHHPLVPLIGGAGGFVVLDDIRDMYSVRCSAPQQSLLLRRCARPENPLPIPTLRKLGRPIGLQNLVKILAGSDLEAVYAPVMIDDCEQPAIVLRLINSGARNILADYIGPCDIRPESRNCNKEGIETINGIGPDCDGNINIRFENFAEGPYDSCGGGITVDQGLGIDDVCLDRAPDRFVGEDLCEDSSSSASYSAESTSSVSATVDPDPVDPEISEESLTCAALPYVETFDDLEAQDFTVEIGEFAFEEFDAPEEPLDYPLSITSFAATDGSRRNVAIYQNCGVESTLNLTVTVGMSLTNIAARQNGGLILNYRIADPLTNPHIEYFSVVLDRNLGKLRLLRFTGVTFVEEQAAIVDPIVLNHWYKLTAVVAPSGGGVLISVTAAGLTDVGWSGTSFSVASNRYLPDDGAFGVGSDRSYTRFGYFGLGDLDNWLPPGSEFQPYFAEGVAVGNLATGTTTYDELSDLTAARLPANAGHLWAVDDASSFLLALRISDCTPRGQWTAGAMTATDAEAIASATIGGTAYLYLGDIGDNSAVRSTIRIYRVKEPTITGSDGVLPPGDVETIICQYPGGLAGARDAEALFVDHATGDMYIITKRTALPEVWRLTHASSYVGTQTLTQVATMYGLPSATIPSSEGHVVGASLAANGLEILVKTYYGMFYYRRDHSATATIAQLLAEDPAQVAYTQYGDSGLHEPKGEAVAFAADDGGYYTISEYIAGSGQSETLFPLFFYRRGVLRPRSLDLVAGINGITVTDTYIDESSPTATYFDDVEFDIDQGPSMRESLLQWNSLGSLLNGDEILSAQLTLYNAIIGDGGSGASLHRMLVDWANHDLPTGIRWANTPWTSGAIPANDIYAAATAEDNIGAGDSTVNVPNGAWRLYPSAATIAAWLAGAGNYGWGLKHRAPSGDNGLSPNTSEGGSTVQASYYTATALVLSNGNPVSTWSDDVINRDATATGSDRPLYLTGVLDGKPVVRFSATSEQFLSADAVATSGIPEAEHALVFVVRVTNISYTGGPGGRVLCAFNTSAGSINGDVYYFSGADGSLRVAQTGVSVANLTPGLDLRNEWSLIIVNRHANGRTTVTVDGRPTFDGDHALSAAMTQFSLGQDWDDAVSSDHFDGDIAEVHILPRALRALEQLELEGYLAHKWGLEANLPDQHLWRDVDPATIPTIVSTTKPCLSISYGR